MVTVFITFIVRHKRCALLRTCQVLASAISCNFVNVCYSYFLVSFFADSTSSTTSQLPCLYIYYLGVYEGRQVIKILQIKIPAFDANNEIADDIGSSG